MEMIGEYLTVIQQNTSCSKSTIETLQEGALIQS